MPFQQTVYGTLAAGIPGELAFDSPLRVSPGQIDPAALAANCVIGRYFSIAPDTKLYVPGGAAVAGVAPVLGGILGFPKEHVASPLGGDPFAPTLTIKPGKIGAFIEMGMVWVVAPAANNVGDVAIYDVITGVISFVAPSATIAAGSLAVPNARVHRVPAAAAGDVCCVKLTN